MLVPVSLDCHVGLFDALLYSQSFLVLVVLVDLFADSFRSAFVEFLVEISIPFVDVREVGLLCDVKHNHRSVVVTLIGSKST